MNQAELAYKIAEKAHSGQFRRGGEPYFEHPKRVAARVKGFGEVFEAAALLHDTAEDAGLTVEYLKSQGVNSEIIEVIFILTKKEGEDYFEYLKKVKENVAAREIKIADMIDNLSDSPTKNQVKKYSKGLDYLIFD